MKLIELLELCRKYGIQMRIDKFGVRLTKSFGSNHPCVCNYFLDDHKIEAVGNDLESLVKMFSEDADNKYLKAEEVKDAEND